MAEVTKTTTTLPKNVFNVEIKNHNLLQHAYQAYLANGRENYAKTLKRGEVSGGGKKPWRQKGTGRARFGSSRNPIWRGGGVAFGPTGNENYSKGLPTAQKRQALRQALSLANQSKKIIIDEFSAKGVVADTLKLLAKHKLSRNTLLVVEEKSDLIDRSTRNVAAIKTVQAMYLNVFDILNADNIVITKNALELIENWLAPAVKTAKPAVKTTAKGAAK